MRIHKEGWPTLILAFVTLTVLNFFIYYFFPDYTIIRVLGYLLTFTVYGLLLNFFRNPQRFASGTDQEIVAPCDGKVVVIEETFEPEYFKDKRIQVSVFMNPLNVHVNRCPVGGKVKLMKYHEGKYLVAFHPKSSIENERTTMVIENPKGEILMRQIAGFVARRIVWYKEEGDQVSAGAEMGFIKFGSRVDLFLPLNAKIRVKLGDLVKGPESIIAEWA